MTRAPIDALWRDGRYAARGFRRNPLFTPLRLSIPQTLVPEPERVLRMQNDIVDTLSGIAGVRSVAFTSSMPMDGFNAGWDVIYAQDRQDVPSDGAPPARRFKHVSPGLFETAGTRLLAGRDFTWTDLYDLRSVVLVSENLAREFWGDPALALGKRIGGPKDWREVIGVVLGLAAATGVTRLMASLLYDVQPVDLPTYLAVAIALTMVAAVASYLPARRASGVDPAEALAAE